jgi:hypothetical protein
MPIEPGACFKQVDKREFGLKSELERSVAKLHVEVDDAGLTAVLGLAFGKADRKLRQQRGRADAPDALHEADQLAVNRRRDFDMVGRRFAEAGNRSFDFVFVERQGNDVGGARMQQGSNQRQRRFEGSGNERRIDRLHQLLESLQRGSAVRIDLDDRGDRPGELLRVDPFGRRQNVESDRETRDLCRGEFGSVAVGRAQVKMDRRFPLGRLPLKRCFVGFNDAHLSISSMSCR